MPQLKPDCRETRLKILRNKTGYSCSKYFLTFLLVLDTCLANHNILKCNYYFKHIAFNF